MTGAVEEIESRSPEDTEALGRRLAAGLEKGAVVWLVGPLGAGKTLLAKAVFGAIGVDPARVTSPTFTLINRYRETGPAGPALYHVDLYRAEGAADLESIGLDEVLESGGVVLVEWAEKLGKRFGRPAMVVEIEDQGGDRRRIRVSRG